MNRPDPRLVLGLAVGYAIWWAVLAIRPVDRSDWLLENLLVFAFVPVLALTWRRFPLSMASYVAIALFLALHAVGAHYTYAKVPLGFWVSELLGQDRNHFDRAIHGAFGLLLVIPIREVLVRWAGVRGFWSWLLPLCVVLASSGLFELAESWIARIVSPELGTAYLGTQGDEWDAQKDMNAALVGAAVTLAFLLWLHRRNEGAPAT